MTEDTNHRRHTHRTRDRSTTRSLILTGLVLLACSCSATDSRDADRASRRPPNIVVILSDDAGYADFGFQGCDQIPTPRIDSIARRGVRFTAGYVSGSVCSPSRAGFMTGRYQQRFGHECNLPQKPLHGEPPEAMGLPVDQRTIAEALRERGYRTACIGKWHLGIMEHFHPNRRGFDEFIGFLYGSRSYFPYEKRVNTNFRVLRQQELQPESGYMTDRLAEEAAAFIDRNREQPFFLFLSFNAVHTPMHAKPETLERFASIEKERRRKLAAMTASLDDGVGLVLDTLSGAGLEEDTIVFFLNDNGGATNNASKNGSLRGQKGDFFEGGMRVPFLVQWPGHLPEGTDFERPVSAMDIFPTSLAAAGGEPDDEPQLDGVDLIPFLRGDAEGEPHPILFWRRKVIAAVRKGDWKLIRVEGHHEMLFDLAADPGESTNLATREPERSLELLRDLESWESGMVDPLWLTEAYWTRNQLKRHGASVE